MKKLFLIIILILYYTKSFTQCEGWKRELIHNAGFEDGDNSKPETYAQCAYLEVWEDDMVDRTSSGNKFYLHSPDWFKDAYGYYILMETKPPFVPHHTITGPVLPNTGNAYIGMENAELIEQKFFTESKLTEGHPYKVSFYIRPVKDAIGQYFDNTAYTGIIIRVYLGKQKIKYLYNQLEDLCSTTWGSFDYCGTQDIIQISDDIIVTATNYPLYEWTKVEFEFIAPSSNYDWFGIEVQDLYETSICDNYLCIDDVSVLPSCTNGCSSTADVKNVCASTQVDEYNPFFIRGLKNLTNVKLIVKTIDYGDVTVLNISNPQDVIAWNCELNGTPIANGIYNYRIEATNDCGTEVFLDQNDRKIVKIEDYDNSYAPNLIYFNYNPVDKPPIPGCKGEIIISGHNPLFDPTLPDPLLYMATNSITAGNNVTILPTLGNKVIFEAGNVIHLTNGFSVKAGAFFNAKISQDITNKSMSITPPSDNVSDNDPKNLIADSLQSISLDEKSKDTIEKTTLTVNPNPFNSKTQIQFSLSESSHIKLTITDMYGVKVNTIADKDFESGNYTFEWNASGCSPGIYFCVLETTKGTQSKRIILTK